jgi:hypothetical protein
MYFFICIHIHIYTSLHMYASIYDRTYTLWLERPNYMLSTCIYTIEFDYMYASIFICTCVSTVSIYLCVYVHVNISIVYKHTYLCLSFSVRTYTFLLELPNYVLRIYNHRYIHSRLDFNRFS